MFRFVTLLAATLAVAHTQTLLYPSTIRQISLPLQSQLQLGSPLGLTQQLQLLPISNGVTTIYRLPQSSFNYQLLLPNYQFQLKQQQLPLLPLSYQPLLQKQLLITGRGGRSLSHGSIPQQQQVVDQGYQQGIQAVHGVQGIQGIQGIQGLQGVQSVQGVQGIQGYQTGGLPVSSGLSSGVQIVPVSSSYGSVQSGLPISNLGGVQGLTVGSTGLGGAVQSHQIPAGQSVGIVVGAQGQIQGVVDTSKLTTTTGEQLPIVHQSSHLAQGHTQQQPQLVLVSGSQPIAQTHQTGAIAQSLPVTYSYGQLASPQTVTTTGQQQQGIYSGAALGSTGHHQESVGHHQVSHVTIPGQVGIGGGYTSSAFYEASPSGSVVIPSVPLGTEPIVASDVKINQKAVLDHQTVGHSTTGQHHQTLSTGYSGVQGYEGKQSTKAENQPETDSDSKVVDQPAVVLVEPKKESSKVRVHKEPKVKVQQKVEQPKPE